MKIQGIFDFNFNFDFNFSFYPRLNFGFCHNRIKIFMYSSFCFYGLRSRAKTIFLVQFFLFDFYSFKLHAHNCFPYFSHSGPLSLSLTHTRTISLSLSLTHSLSYSLTHSLSLLLTHSLSLSLTLPLSLSYSLSLSLTLFLTLFL